jgi:hypothetical protein
VVEARGGTLQDIIKLNIYTTDRNLYLDNRPAIGDIYRQHLAGTTPP